MALGVQTATGMGPVPARALKGVWGDGSRELAGALAWCHLGDDHRPGGAAEEPAVGPDVSLEDAGPPREGRRWRGSGGIGPAETGPGRHCHPLQTPPAW